MKSVHNWFLDHWRLAVFVIVAVALAAAATASSSLWLPHLRSYLVAESAPTAHSQD
jgi:hypothetical protein